MNDSEPCPTITTFSNMDVNDAPAENEEEDKEEEPDQIMEELKQSINEIEKQMNKEQSDSDSDDDKDEAPAEGFRDFSFADMFSNIESSINNSEKMCTKRDIFNAVKDSVKGTKAERPVKKMLRRMRKKGCKPRKMMKAFHRMMGGGQWRKHCGRKRQQEHAHTARDEIIHTEVPVNAGDATADQPANVDIELPEGVEVVSAHWTGNGEHPHVNFRHGGRGCGRGRGRGRGRHGHGHGPLGHGPHGHGPHGHGPHHGPFGHGPPFHGGAGMRRMFKDFMKMFADVSESEDSISDDEKKQRRERNLKKRPACIEKPEGELEYKTGEFAFLEVTVQN